MSFIHTEVHNIISVPHPQTAFFTVDKYNGTGDNIYCGVSLVALEDNAPSLLRTD